MPQALLPELFFRTTRSGGKGGQNVNKVETAVTAWWHIASSAALKPEEKELVLNKLQNRINKEGYLTVKSTEHRTQLENKATAQEKLLALVAKALIVPKKRKPSKPTRSAIAARLDSKRKDAIKKTLRKKDWD